MRLFKSTLALLLLMVAACSTVSTQVDHDTIKQTMNDHKYEFKTCFDKKQTEGRVIIHFVIGSGGQVTEASTEETSYQDHSIDECIVKVVKKIRFPDPGEASTTVRYPIVYKKQL